MGKSSFVRRGVGSATVTAMTAALLVLPTGPATAAATTVALWHMNDTGSQMSDSSGEGNDGSLTDVLVGESGKKGTAFGFSGSPSVVKVNSSSSLDPETSAFSVTLSVRFPTKPSSSVVDYDLVRKGESATSGGHYKVEILRSGVAFCQYRGSSASAAVTGSKNLADNRWHTIKCKRTASSVSLIVDGSTKTVKKKTGTISNSEPVYVGAKSTGGDDQYTGLMDEVKITKG